MNQSLQTIVPAVLLGALGMWLLLPRPSLRGRMAGGAAAAAALGLIASRLPMIDGMTVQGLFYVIAGVRCSAHSENIREVDFFTSEFYHENVNYPGLEQLWSEGGLWWHIKHPDMPKED